MLFFQFLNFEVLDEPRTRYVSVWVVADFEDAEGRELAYNTVRRLKHSHNLRVGFLSNPVDVRTSVFYRFLISQYYFVIMDLLQLRLMLWMFFNLLQSVFSNILP